MHIGVYIYIYIYIYLCTERSFSFSLSISPCKTPSMSPRFEHLEHIDDDLSWEGLQAAAQDAIKPSRLSSGTVGKLVPNRELPSLKLT